MEKCPETWVAEMSCNRLDKYLATVNNGYSRGLWQEAIGAGAVQVNGQVADQRMAVNPGDVMAVNWRFFCKESPKPEPLPLEILYEDESLAVVNKPAGMQVHPDACRNSGTLVNGMLAHWPFPEYEAMLDDEQRPGIVHRLDKDTSGCILVARNLEIYGKMKLAFQEHRVHKWYLAIVDGNVTPKQGRIELPLGPDPRSWRRRSVRFEDGKEAITEYETLAEASQCSLLKVRIFTGRTHQIRVHLSHLGHPVLGDELYGGIFPWSREFAPRQLLHSWRLSFLHPITGSIVKVQAPLPEEFKLAIKAFQLKRRHV